MGTVLNKKGICKDQNNEDIYGKTIQGRLLSARDDRFNHWRNGFSRGHHGLCPAACSFQSKGYVGVSGGVLARYWSDKPFIMVDNLGDEF